MKIHKALRVLVAALFVWLAPGVLDAAERDSYGRQQRGAVQQSDDFDQAIDLENFRKGNPEWDTQELIASGFRALHQENTKILKELVEIKQALSRIEAMVGVAGGMAGGTTAGGATAGTTAGTTSKEGRKNVYRR